MNTYEQLVAEYNNKIQTISSNETLTNFEKFCQQAQLRVAYEQPLASAFLASYFQA